MEEKPIRVLLIEDNPGDFRLIREMFKESGANVELEWAKQLSTGLANLKEEIFDGLLVDLGLPDSQGIGTFKKIHDQAPQIPIIVLTGLADNGLALKAVREGAQDYLVKGQIESNLLVRSVHYAIERKRAEEALRESKARFQELFNEAPVGYHEVDAEGRIFRVNRTELEMLGYTAEEMLGQSVSKFTVKEKTPQQPVLTNLTNIVSSTQGFERTYQRKDGTTIPVLVERRVIREANGKVKSIRSTIQDITERKRAEEEREKMQAQLIQAQKMESIGTLAGGVAHDFNNLLTTIQGYAQLAMMSLKESDPFYENFKEIRQASVRAANLTRQLLLFSRQQAMDLNLINLNATVGNLMKMLRRLIGEDITIQTDLDPNLWMNMADAGNMEQVIMNLVVNARDAMPEGKNITIKTENVDIDEGYCETYKYAHPGKFVCLSVEDTGVGMDKEIIQHIFDPFFTTKGPGKGTGLGLSVVYGIVKQHEGWINVYSEPGRGSVFKVYLPASSVESKGEAKEEVISIQDCHGKGERILLVEDDDEIREFAKRVLFESGYVGFEAANAEEALSIFGKEKGDFHLVFSDVVLPVKSGLQLVEQLLCRKPELKVLLTSGYTDQKSQWPVICEKGYRFIQKPYGLTCPSGEPA